MKIFNKILVTLIVLIALIVGGVAIFVATFDANNYKDEIVSLVKKQTGRDVNIQGDITLKVYPDIALALGKTSLSNAPGFGNQPFATIDSGNISVKLLPLLKKQLKVDAVLLDGLNLNLERKANGTTNWDDLLKQSNKDQKASTAIKTGESDIQAMLQDLSIAGIRLKNARIHWKDALNKQDISLAPLHLSTGKIKPGKPVPLEIDLTFKQKNPALTVVAKGKTIATLTNNNQSFTLDHLVLNTKITGAPLKKSTLVADINTNIKGAFDKITLNKLTIKSKLSGDLVPQGAITTDIQTNASIDLKQQLINLKSLTINNALNGQLLAGGQLTSQLQGDATLNLKQKKLSLPNLRINSSLKGGYAKKGQINTVIKGQSQFDLVQQILSLNGLDLVADVTGELVQNGQAKSHVQGDLKVNLAQSTINSPKITINSQLQGGLVPGGQATQSAQGNLNLNWKNKQGAVNLSNLLLKLAGLELTGKQVKILPLATQPNVLGQFQTNTFNLKKLLKTLGITPPKTSNPKALTQVQARFQLDANTENLKLDKLKVTLDKSLLQGSLAIKNLQAPAIYPQLTIDRINLDDYLAPAENNKQQQKTSSANSKQQPLLPIDTLRKLNLDGRFKIAHMVVNKLKLDNITARIKAKQGLIIIDPANASLYNGKYQGRITINAKQTPPSMKMHHELVGLRSEGLLYDLFQDKYISGNAKLVTDLSSRGNTLNELLRNLNGKTSIAFKNGTIRDSNLAEKISLAVKVFEKKELKDGKSVVKFTGLSGDWKTTNGVFKTDNLSLLSPYFKILGSGTADVASQKLDFKLRILPSKKQGGRDLFAPLHIVGTFSHPKFKLDLQDLIKAVAQQDIDKLKAKAKKRLAAEKQALNQKLKDEQKKQEQKLKQKLTTKKEAIINKLGSKTGNLLEGQLNKLRGKNTNAQEQQQKPTETSPQEPPKSVEDKVKDKLKNKLRGLF